MKDRQQLLWIPVAETLPGYGRPVVPPIDYSGKRPKYCWTLMFYNDPENPPRLPFAPVHNVNAFMEDWGHDINIRNEKLIYRSRVSDGGHWFLMEFADAPIVKFKAIPCDCMEYLEHCASLPENSPLPQYRFCPWCSKSLVPLIPESQV